MIPKNNIQRKDNEWEFVFKKNKTKWAVHFCKQNTV